MADSKPKTVKAHVLRDFNDAGTERNFVADATVEITEGEFANYRAAGLVEATDTAKPAA